MPDVQLITPAALRTALWQTCFHANLGRGGYTLNKECLAFPGLVVSDSFDRKARKNTRTFYVEGDRREFTTIQDAAKAWNDLRRAPAAAPERAA